MLRNCDREQRKKAAETTTTMKYLYVVLCLYAREKLKISTEIKTKWKIRNHTVFGFNLSSIRRFNGCRLPLKDLSIPTQINVFIRLPYETSRSNNGQAIHSTHTHVRTVWLNRFFFFGGTTKKRSIAWRQPFQLIYVMWNAWKSK